jgi:uncharacterized protein YdbL (DUF1318 family)
MKCADARKTAARVGAVLAVLALAVGCGGPLVDVNVTVVDQKTSLENQILGSYQELGDDMMLLASVRSVDKEGKLKSMPSLPPGKLKAIRAMQRREFNRDDIQTLKQSGVVGEGNDGLLVFFENERTQKDPTFKAFAQNQVKEENEDRLATLERVVAVNENLSEGDLPKVRKIAASLNRDNAKSGEKIQLETGAWSTKK